MINYLKKSLKKKVYKNKYCYDKSTLETVKGNEILKKIGTSPDDV